MSSITVSESVSQSVTKVGLELLGQLKKLGGNFVRYFMVIGQTVGGVAGS